MPLWHRDKLLSTLLFCGLLLSLVPLLLPRLLPLLDQPNHLAAVAIWHRIADPAWGYDRCYRLNLAPVPYLAYYLPVHLLAYVLPLEVANKLVLALYAVGLPLSLLALLRRLGRSPYLVLLALPFLFNYNLAYGFLPLCIGLPPLFLALALLHDVLERPTLPRAAALCGLTFLCYFSHILVWLFLGLLSGALLILDLGTTFVRAVRGRPASLRAFVTAAAALLPSVPLALWSLRGGPSAQMPVQSSVVHALGASRARLDFEGVRFPLKRQLQELPDQLLMTGPGTFVPMLLLALAATVLLLHATTSWRRPRASKEAPPAPSATPLLAEVGLALALLCATLLPFTLRKPFHYWNIAPRFWSVAALFALLTVRAPLRGRSRLLLAPALALCAAYPLWLFTRFQRFNDRARGAVTLLAAVPRGAEVLVVPLGSRSDPGLHKDLVPFTEFQSWAQIWVGGFNHVGWKLDFPYVIDWKKAPKTPHWAYPETFRQTTHGAEHDYVLSYQESEDYALFADRPDLRPRVPLLGHVGPWRLYRTRDIR